MTESGGGKLIPCHEARQFGRYALNIVRIYSTYILEGVATDISNQKIAHVEGLLSKQSICQWSCKDFCKIR